MRIDNVCKCLDGCHRGFHSIRLLEYLRTKSEKSNHACAKRDRSMHHHVWSLLSPCHGVGNTSATHHEVLQSLAAFGWTHLKATVADQTPLVRSTEPFVVATAWRCQGMQKHSTVEKKVNQPEHPSTAEQAQPSLYRLLSCGCAELMLRDNAL